MWILERVWQKEAKDETREDREGAHEREQPEPTSFAANASHVQDAIGKELGRGLTELIAKVEEHDALCGLGPRVPCRQCPESTWDEARLGDAKQKAGDDERCVVRLEGLKRRHDTEEEELKREPLSRANSVQYHVRWDLSEDDAKRQHLLANVKLVLINSDVLHEVIRDGVGHVASIQLQAKEAQKHNWHDDQVKSACC